MAKTRKDHTREQRIENEIVVDAYGPEERALGWYYYLEDKIHFPFQAKWWVSCAKLLQLPLVTRPYRKHTSGLRC
jgi:Calcium binding